MESIPPKNFSVWRHASRLGDAPLSPERGVGEGRGGAKHGGQLYTTWFTLRFDWVTVGIDKLYSQIGNAFRLPWIESFSVLCWAICIVLAHILKLLTQPTGLASLNSDTGTVLYGRGQLDLIWLKISWLPAFSDLAILFIYGVK